MSMRSGFACLLTLTLLCVGAMAQTVSLTVPTELKVGQTTPIQATIKNDLAVLPVQTVKAWAVYTDSGGTVVTSPTSQVDVNIIQPQTYNKLVLDLPKMDLSGVEASVVASVPVTTTIVVQQVTFGFDKRLLAQESMAITFNVTAQK